MPKVLQAQKKRSAKLAKKQKFRVLAGKHHQSERVGKTEGGQPILRTITFLPGEIVESETDLVKLHGKDKYAYAGDNDVSEVIDRSSDENPDEDALDAMTVEELRAHAEAEEIDLTGATKKAEIISRIRSAQG